MHKKENNYKWIDPSEVLKNLDVTREEFLDSYLLCSVENRSTLPGTKKHFFFPKKKYIVRIIQT